MTCAREARPYSEAPAPAPGPAPAAEPSVAPPSISTSFGLVSVKLILKSNEMSFGKTGSVTANDSPDAIKLEIGFSRFGLPFIALGHRTLRVGFTPAARTHRVAARKASGLGSHTLSAGVDSVGSLSCLQGVVKHCRAVPNNNATSHNVQVDSLLQLVNDLLHRRRGRQVPHPPRNVARAAVVTPLVLEGVRVCALASRIPVYGSGEDGRHDTTDPRQGTASPRTGNSC